ncbi:IpaD/SipD/SspD family type III secretion system needle tip protein [Pseudomonas sp. C1C7]|uniref:IpaD/SipD/SspD family type III secretion system needle tip protein n=1 Tax=Pseudomonas sp. C1C7 TaxID=2735272 RepID=UPI0015861127|nr:IpaD/SipD/SspD family type III secretion system needle tip protein [Pseudomonas sp. C1C7]NUT77288.1 IpaD/SipD/SspD family type III secretion system needle tip protein [Pseudomonas sp. C1C7]
MANSIGIAHFVPPAHKAAPEVRRANDVPLLAQAQAPVEGVEFSLAQMIDRSIKTLNRSFDAMLMRCADKGMRQELWVHQLSRAGAVLTDCQQSLPSVSHQHLEAAQMQIMRDLKERHPPPADIAEAFDQAISSSDDFFEKLLELIDLIKNGYLAGYEHIVAAYSDFFADFNKDITAKLKEWIQGANDGKEVKINAGEIRLALQALINKYSHPNPASVLFPAPGMGGASREEAEKWRQALGLPASCLKQNADGTYSVVMDLSPLTIMRDSLPPNVFWIAWDTAKFQAWQTGFNAQEERMKNLLQSLTQKYSNANSYHDNFNKTLSSHLNQYADMLKAMLNF